MITKTLREISVTTPYSLDYLKGLKYHFCLTDLGVKEVAYEASQRALSPYQIAETIFYSQGSVISHYYDHVTL